MSEIAYVISFEEIKALDALYQGADDAGPGFQKHQPWGVLVDERRAIRRLVESGVTVSIEGTGTVLTSWQGFYAWAHGRYYEIEDGYDRWIGDDS